jgi:hypothetical protein
VKKNEDILRNIVKNEIINEWFKPSDNQIYMLVSDLKITLDDLLRHGYDKDSLKEDIAKFLDNPNGLKNTHSHEAW